MDIRDYWKKIRIEAGKLDPEAAEQDRQETEQEDRRHLRTSGKEVWISSLDNAEKGSVAGQTCTATPWIAAINIFEARSRLATAGEISQEKKRLLTKREEIIQTEIERKTQTHVNQQLAMPPELTEALKALASREQQPTLTPEMVEAMKTLIAQQTAGPVAARKP